MKLKYWGLDWQKGLSLTADLYDNEGIPIYKGFPMSETVNNDSAIYRTENIFDTIPLIGAGIYVVRIITESGEFIGHQEIIFNGIREVTLLELKFMSEKELMQLRDALGIDGDKMIAKDGQLQKKSEYPYNNTIDSRKI